MSDLVKRLRRYEPTYDIYDEAADRVEELEAENQLLRDDRASRFAQTERRYRELQRKHDALAKGVKKLSHENYAVGRYDSAGELRALLKENDDG